MQSDVPPLPISCLTDNICLHRTSNFKAKLLIQDNSNKNFKSNNSISSNKKQLRSLISLSGTSPYKNSARFNQPNTCQSSSKSIIGQRVSSAKMLRIKQLQSQLADAHFHLNELSNENKLLKAIQKRQDTALKRYEGANAELPRIINSHHEDLRVLQTKYKKLKSQCKETSDTLKEKENELLSLQLQNKKLMQLSKDRHLGEREKLQMQVFDLNHRINQQDEIIQTLKRKLALESKYLKHQLNAEMTKHKETQKQLQDTQSKLNSLEELMEQREKKSYLARRTVVFNKDRATIASQSLTNLNENRTEIANNGDRRHQNNEKIIGHSLPTLNESTLVTKGRLQEVSLKSNQEISSNISEALINVEQVRSSRHTKSPILHRRSLSTSRNSVRNSSIKESQLEYNNSKENQMDAVENIKNSKKIYKLPKALKQEFNYGSDDDKNKEYEDKINNEEKDKGRINDSVDPLDSSKSLHIRLVNSATEGVQRNKTLSTNRSQSLTKENIENIVENNKTILYDRDSVITVISKDMLRDDKNSIVNYSNSNVQSDLEIPIDFNTDEDKNVIRKSDININKSEISYSNTLSHVSKLFNKQFPKPQNYSLDLQGGDEIEMQINRNNSKSEFKLMNGLLTPTHLTEQDVTKNKYNEIVQDKLISSEDLNKIQSDNNECKQNCKEDVQNSFMDHKINHNKEKEIDEHEVKLLNNSNQEIKEVEEIKKSSYSDSYNPNNLNKLEECTVDSRTQQKTVNENYKSFDKAKLLAAMKAIDDNENIEFISQKSRKNSISNQLKITENLYKGIPTHSRKKTDIMKELFPDSNMDNNITCKEN